MSHPHHKSSAKSQHRRNRHSFGSTRKTLFSSLARCVPSWHFIDLAFPLAALESFRNKRTLFLAKCSNPHQRQKGPRLSTTRATQGIKQFAKCEMNSHNLNLNQKQFMQICWVGTLMCEAGNSGGVDDCAEGMRQSSWHCYGLTSIVLFQITGNKRCKSAPRSVVRSAIRGSVEISIRSCGTKWMEISGRRIQMVSGLRPRALLNVWYQQVSAAGRPLCYTAQHGSTPHLTKKLP